MSTATNPRSECEQCGAATQGDTALCWDCTKRFVDILRKVIGVTRQTSSPFDDERQLGLATELRLALTRQHVRATNRGGKSGEREQPLPFDERAGRALTKLQLALVEALDYVGSSPVSRDVVMLTGDLLEVVTVLRRHRGCSQHVSAVTDAVTNAENVLEPLRLAYVGPCSTDECTDHLRAEQGAQLVQCPSCGTHWDVATVRARLVQLTASQLLGATDIARALTAANGHSVSLRTVQDWVARGRLIPAARTGSGKPRYRVADAQRLLEIGAARRRGQSAKG